MGPELSLEIWLTSLPSRSISTMKTSFYTFFPKSQKPVKAIIRHLPSLTPAEDIYEALIEVGVKQMSPAQRTNEEGSQPKILPLFLISLPTEKSPEIF
jgi:hypothetical protein